MILISSALFCKKMDKLNNDEMNKEAFNFELNINENDAKKMVKAGVATLAAKMVLDRKKSRELPTVRKLSAEEVVEKKTKQMAEKIIVKFEKDKVVFLYPKLASRVKVAEIHRSKMNMTFLSFYKKKDKEFFKNWFKAQSFQDAFTKIASDESSEMEKVAISKNNASTMFLRSDISPVCYFKAMSRKYKSSFLNLDAEVLLKKIEIDFGLDPFPINDIALGKLFWIQNINSNTNTFESPFAFEKLIRAFNDKSFDFFVSQHEDITPTEIAYTLNILSQVTPDISVYKVINADVIKFIAERLYSRGCEMFWPLEVSKGEGQLDLYRSINTEIARLVINADSGEENKLNTSEKMKNVLIKSKDLYTAYRNGSMDMDLLKSNIKALEIQDIYTGKKVMFQVYLNIGMDAYIKNAKVNTEEQLKAYALK